MKMIKYAATALILTSLSFGAMATVHSVTSAEAQNLQKSGTVAVTGASTLDSLEAKLAAKAQAAGARAYSITSANTDGKMSGTAVIYQ
ncbi:multiple stress resistance protein BhsA [Klebsiella sp. BIGb0407]|uniref:multiple stress resistance protein BhsA n=1 Tax=Klebsiella sp. BIGb0407 TaxID=2940603 RepID=UPI002166C2EB|nr:YdgH/BhsA/McbA-like domain containing protein [Klebsiella sp. BIGb0407]